MFPSSSSLDAPYSLFRNFVSFGKYLSRLRGDEYPPRLRLGESRIPMRFSSRPRSVPDGVCTVFELGSPFEVFKFAIGGVSVQMSRLKSFWTRANEGLKYKLVNKSSCFYTKYAECNLWPPICTDPLAFNQWLIEFLSAVTSTFAPRPDASEGTHFVERVARNWTPNFHGISIVSHYVAFKQTSEKGKKGG